MPETKYFLTIAASLALLNAVASVAQPATPDASTTTTSASSTATSTSTRALQEPDKTFLRKAAEADQKEIASAQAAISGAQRAETRDAAKMILEDHRASSQKLQQLASRKGWALPAPATGTAESDQARTASTSGAGIDDRFMAEQVKMHKEAISLYRAQAAGGTDPDLREFARQQLPHLEHHLEMVQGTAKAR